MMPESDHQEDASNEGVPVEVAHVPAAKKKKKKSRPQSQRGLNKPTGFEEFHAEVLTPDEAAQDATLYSEDLSFISRILTAIQRFERTRKLSSERRDVFYKYLAYGGVDIGPNMFQGASSLSSEQREDMSKTDLAAAVSQASINDDKNDLTSDSRLYEVDFQGCMRSFLSRRAVMIRGFENEESVRLVTTTLERFMDYLLQHGVCPEYKTQVLATRDLCREATQDLWSTAEAGRRLPGDFNIACSTLFGGQFARDYDGETSWAPAESGKAEFVGFTPELASQIIKFGVAGAASEAVYRSYIDIVNDTTNTKTFSVIETIPSAGFEITKIQPPSKDCLRLYRAHAPDFRPVGRVHAKPWHNPDAPQEDISPPVSPSLTPSSTAAPSASLTNENETYTFLIEAPILKLLHIGTKLVATVHKLNVGIHYFDEFQTCFPAWTDYCEGNELMQGWKAPRWIEAEQEAQEAQEGDHPA